MKTYLMEYYHSEFTGITYHRDPKTGRLVDRRLADKKGRGGYRQAFSKQMKLDYNPQTK